MFVGHIRINTKRRDLRCPLSPGCNCSSNPLQSNSEDTQTHYSKPNQYGSGGQTDCNCNHKHKMTHIQNDSFSLSFIVMKRQEKFIIWGCHRSTYPFTRLNAPTLGGRDALHTTVALKEAQYLLISV